MREKIPATAKMVFQGLVYVYLLAPILIVIPVSFSDATYLVFPPRGFSLRWYANFFSLRELTDALALSVRLGVVVTVASTTIGTMASFALVRHGFPGRNALRTLFLSPMVLPGVVLGIGFLIFFSRARLIHTFWSLLLAHLIVTLPYVIRTVSATLQGFPRVLEEAGASLGASPIAVFRTITLPLLKTGILAGAIFAFIVSFDELVISIFLTGPRLSTLPVQIYNYIEFTSDPTIAAISVILILLTTAAVTLLERFVGFGRL
jgi:putative spermidine/putrescine transport system permease protein